MDTYGDPLVFGKQIGGDIINTKKTWLLITAISECRTELLDILAEDLEPQERINQVRAVYDRLNLKDRCHDLIVRYADMAVRSLENISLGNDARDYFVNLAERSIDRNY